jgi:hypothetical protein
MNHRTPALGYLFPALLFFAAPTVAAGSEQPRPSPLKGVAALEKPVTYTETKIPLGELVHKVAADTDVPLTASREVADEPVAVVVKGLPARELLQQLAELLDYTWSRRTPMSEPPTPAFEIYQDLAARNRETALRERRMRETEARFREEIQLHAGMAALPSDAFERLLTAAAERSRQKPTSEQLAARLRTADGREQIRRDDAVHALQTPVQRALARLVNQLPLEQWDRLRTAGRLTFSTNPAPGELPLPGDTARLLRSAGPTWRTQGWWLEPPTPEDEARYREDDRQINEAWTAAAGYRVTVDWEIHPLTFRSGLSLAARASPLGDAARTEGPIILPLGSSPGAMLFLSAGPYELPHPDEELTPEQRAALAKDPILGAIAQYRPDSKAPAPSAGSSTREKRFQEYLPELARLYHVAFLADAYWGSPRLGPDALPAEPTPLFELLERLLGATYRWDRRDHLVRLRSRNWFLERPCEVPLRLVRQWNDETTHNGAPSLDTLADCAAALSDPQIDSLSSRIASADLSDDFALIHAGRLVLRLYATLTPAQRQALWQHQRVSLARIWPAQRLLAAALREALRNPEGAWSPEQLAEASLSLEDSRLIRVRQQRGDTLTEQEFEPSAPQLTPSGGAAPAASSAKAVTTTRYPLARVTLFIHYDGGWPGSPPFIVAPP